VSKMSWLQGRTCSSSPGNSLWKGPISWCVHRMPGLSEQPHILLPRNKEKESYSYHPEGIPTLTQWWDLCGQIKLTAMLVVA